MLAFLRFFGVSVAAIWLGASVFFTFFAAPAFFSDEMKRLLPEPYNGAAAHLVLSRYFVLHYVCGGLALIHLAAEWLYSGRIPARPTVWLAVGLLGLGLIGGGVLQPKLHRWQTIKYAEHYRVTATPEERTEAARSFRVWHGVSQAMNLVALAGLWFYLVRIVTTGELPRFVPGTKFGIDKRI